MESSFYASLWNTQKHDLLILGSFRILFSLFLILSTGENLRLGRIALFSESILVLNLDFRLFSGSVLGSLTLWFTGVNEMPSLISIERSPSL